MKNRKVLYVGIGIIVIGVIILLIFVLNKNGVISSKTLVDEAKENTKKDEDYAYNKVTNGDILNEDTCFNKYAFISNNAIYIFNPSLLDSGNFEYKKVYDIPSNIKVMNIRPSWGADIAFFDDKDILYTLHDNNTDNKVRDSYDMYLNADYKLSDYLKWEYSTEYLGKKIDYDFMSNYVYVKDNIIYRLLYNSNDKYPTIDKVSGNYEGEKVIRIYNERIVKTDKGFYELMSYFDTDLNKTITTTVKINLLTKYYDDVLTFTYKYVILKDYTLIPINDVMTNRVRDYSDDSFISGFNYMSEVRYEE